MRQLILVIGICGFILAPHAGAVDSTDTSDRASPTVFVRTEYGFTSVKSKLVASNDTGTFMSYAAGLHAAEDHSIGVLYRSETTATTFALTESNITTEWKDTFIRYRLGGFYLGAVISSLALTAKNGDTSSSLYAAEPAADFTTLDISGSGYGGNTGFIIGANRSNSWYLDVTSVSISNAIDVNQTPVSIGSRLDIDTGVLFFLSRQSWDMRFGYKMRTYSVGVNGTSYAEAQNQTYLALQLNGFF